MKTAWARAAELAAQTPASRNRYVDFLRALSILAVISGHWLAAAPHVNAEGRLTAMHVLGVSPWTHWLTWVVQVMPVFFMVGGFSNGITWRTARRDGTHYGAWLEGRLKRLVWPVLPLLVAWIVIGVLANLRGVRPEMVRVGSQMALIPTWFLAVYVGVVVLVPITHALWERAGWVSFWGFAAASVVDDLLFFRGQAALGWFNYLFVWSAVHQLGYAWSDGKLDDWRKTISMFVGGLALLVVLTSWTYPRAMVGVPDEAISNTTPPKITLIALACAQGGLLLSLQALARRWLARPGPWTATVLINGMIMTIYLWHLTAMALAIGLLYALRWSGLELEPGSGAWWRGRPLWFAILAAVLLPFVMAFRRFERPKASTGAPPDSWRLVAGAFAICLGLAILAKFGIATEPDQTGGVRWFGLRLWALALPFVGAALIGLGPIGNRRKAAERPGST